MSVSFERPLIKKSRKFNNSQYYEHNNSDYFLLPFMFIQLNEKKEILVNEVGDFLIVEKGTAQRIILKQEPVKNFV